MDSRSSWVDYAKAIGILLVVYGHVARGLYAAGIPMPVALYERVDSIIYSFHMPLFFFLSGLFFYSSFAKRGAGGLALSKIDTIFYPYALWSIVQGVIEAALADYTNGDATYRQVFALLWMPRAHFWFLYALFFCFLAAILLFALLPRLALQGRQVALAAFVLAALIYEFPQVLPDGVASAYLSQNLVYFMIGVMFSLYCDIRWFANFSCLLLLGLAFAVSQYLFQFHFALDYVTRGAPALLLALVSIMFMVSLSAVAARRPHRPMLYLGSASMAIYLLHILAGSGVRVALSKGAGVDSYLIHLLIGFMVGVGLPLICYWLVQKWRVPYVFSAPISQLFSQAHWRRARPSVNQAPADRPAK